MDHFKRLREEMVWKGGGANLYRVGQKILHMNPEKVNT